MKKFNQMNLIRLHLIFLNNRIRIKEISILAKPKKVLAALNQILFFFFSGYHLPLIISSEIVSKTTIRVLVFQSIFRIVQSRQVVTFARNALSLVAIQDPLITATPDRIPLVVGRCGGVEWCEPRYVRLVRRLHRIFVDFDARRLDGQRTFLASQIVLNFVQVLLKLIQGVPKIVNK